VGGVKRLDRVWVVDSDFFVWLDNLAALLTLSKGKGQGYPHHASTISRVHSPYPGLSTIKVDSFWQRVTHEIKRDALRKAIQPQN
jgi:hypothetical protein